MIDLISVRRHPSVFVEMTLEHAGPVLVPSPHSAYRALPMQTRTVSRV